MQKNTKKISVFIAEDHDIVRYGLKELINQQDDIEVISESSSCKETLKLSSTLNPDVILLNLTLKDGESLDCIPKLKEHCPDSSILIYTASTDKQLHLRALSYGAIGILLKSETMELICKAIRNVYLNNELWVNRTLMTEIWKHNILEAKTTQPYGTNKSNSLTLAEYLTPLTPREAQIACLLSKGLKAKKIGEKLFISEKTVRNQLTIIYSKTQLKNQLELSINGNFVNSCKNNKCPFQDNCPN